MPTHGSLTKAGKVRSQTRKIAAKPKKSPIPRVKSFKSYEKRIVLSRQPGQNWPGTRRRRR